MFSPAPSGLSEVGWDVAAVAVLMAIWWATETVPVAITALLPLALFPLLGVTSFENAAVPYANKNIYLFFLPKHQNHLFGVHCFELDRFGSYRFGVGTAA